MVVLAGSGHLEYGQGIPKRLLRRVPVESAILLNDVGPELNLVGIDRIKTYVGRSVVFGSLEDAAAELRGRHSEVHPGYGDAQWERYARRVVHKTDRGFEIDYDMRIAEPASTTPATSAPGTKGGLRFIPCR